MPPSRQDPPRVAPATGEPHRVPAEPPAVPDAEHRGGGRAVPPESPPTTEATSAAQPGPSGDRGRGSGAELLDRLPISGTPKDSLRHGREPLPRKPDVTAAEVIEATEAAGVTAGAIDKALLEGEGGGEGGAPVPPAAAQGEGAGQPAPRTVGWLITTLQAYEELSARAPTSNRAVLEGSAEAAALIRAYQARQAMSADIDDVPGIDRLTLLCDELDNSHGLTAANIVKLRAKVCRAKPCSLGSANALTLDEFADVIESGATTALGGVNDAPRDRRGAGEGGGGGELVTSSTPAKKPKRSTESGEGRAKLIAALTKHHQYADGSCLNPEPIGNNELARLAGVSPSTASDFFDKEFGGKEREKGHARYKVVCRDAGRLADSLKVLNREFSPHDLFGRRPPGETERDEDE